MRLGWKIAWFAGCIMGAARASAAPMTQPPILEYSQDGTNFFPFATLSGHAKAGTYYDYRNDSGHPAFGTGRGISTAAFYWDDRHSLLSFMAISGAPGRGKGSVKYTFDSLPASTVLSLSDDPREFKYSAGKAHASAYFRYHNGTDGLVFGGLQQSSSMTMEMAITPVKRVNEWHLVNGDLADGGTIIDLDMNKPLFLRATKVGAVPGLPPASGNSGGLGSNPSVPEPGLALGIVGTLGLLIFRRRR
jgi:hypothetical protein